jgi:nitrite reductase/ring-hydroxylating ferredoxin subunit/DMSO/TMAO reductase YedYZ heme-binding membrane subunit
MSATYKPISWTPYKRRYDIALICAIVAYLSIFIAAGKLRWRATYSISDEILLMRALATAAFILLTITLCIGPLARLDRRFLPLLYNRRHLGVITFLLGLAHAILATGFYHGFGKISPVTSLLTSNTQYRSLIAFPFEILGAIALMILFLMAATSHDFWLKNLSAPVWKRLHMCVYLAYTLLIAHVAFGALQSERNWTLVALVFAGMATVITCHLLAARKEQAIDESTHAPVSDGFVEVCDFQRIPENRAVIVSLNGERIAVFRHENKVSAISNVCQHQNGPLGEGRILNGCITCPWHGYQYLPDTGMSPPPYKEKVPVFPAKIVDGKVFVHPCPKATTST